MILFIDLVCAATMDYARTDGFEAPLSPPTAPPPADALTQPITITLTPYQRRRRYLCGLLLLGLVVCLWVGSSTMIQQIFIGLQYHQPFFLTYYSTSLFILYLPLYGIRQYLSRHCSTHLPWFSCCCNERSRMRRERIRLPTTTGHADREDSRSDSHAQATHLIANPPTATTMIATPATPVMKANRSYDSHSSHTRIEVQPTDGLNEEFDVGVEPTKMSLRDTAKLSLFLCPFWFFMNYFFNLSLNLTTIASSTILSTTSSLFVLVFSFFLDPSTKIRFQHLLGVCLTIVGVVFISWKDTDEQDNESATPDGTKYRLVGDILATIGAIVYGFYTVILKLRIPNDDLIEMQLVFGFLGLFNALLFWPGFFLLNVSGVETWSAPPGQVLLFLTLNGLFGTVISDFVWAKSVLLTSPIIASLGLALTIPLAVLVDWLIHDLTFTYLYLIGGLCVLIGFILVNLVHSKSLENDSPVIAASLSDGSSITTDQSQPTSSDLEDIDLSPLALAFPNHPTSTVIVGSPHHVFHDVSLTASNHLDSNHSHHDDEEEDDDDPPIVVTEDGVEKLDLQPHLDQDQTEADGFDSDSDGDERQSRSRTYSEVPPAYF